MQVMSRLLLEDEYQRKEEELTFPSVNFFCREDGRRDSCPAAIKTAMTSLILYSIISFQQQKKQASSS